MGLSQDGWYFETVNRLFESKSASRLSVQLEREDYAEGSDASQRHDDCNLPPTSLGNNSQHTCERGEDE